MILYDIEAIYNKLLELKPEKIRSFELTYTPTGITLNGKGYQVHRIIVNINEIIHNKKNTTDFIKSFARSIIF